MAKQTISPRRWLLLPVETIARELHGKLLLACVAAERGWGVVLGSKHVVRSGQDALPRGTFIEKSIAPGRFKAIQRALTYGNRVSSWCEEGLFYLGADDYLPRRTEWASFQAIDFFFAWGARHAMDMAVIEEGASRKIVRTGNPRFDLLRPELRKVFQREADRYRRKYGRLILVNSNFATVNHNRKGTDVLEDLHKGGRVGSDAQLARIKRFLAYKESLCAHFMRMIPLLAETFPEHCIVVRPHPSEDHAPWHSLASGLKNVNVIYEGSANEWILAADVVIQNNCTTGVEAFLLDRPVISYRPEQSEELESDLVNGVTHQIEKDDQLMDLLKRIVSGREPLDAAEREARYAVARDYVENADGPLACDRILDVLDKVDLPLCDAVFPLQGGLVRFFNRQRKAAREWLTNPRQKAYTNQKFPGISRTWMEQLLVDLQHASGRFHDVEVRSVAESSYVLYRP